MCTFGLGRVRVTLWVTVKALIKVQLKNNYDLQRRFVWSKKNYFGPLGALCLESLVPSNQSSANTAFFCPSFCCSFQCPPSCLDTESQPQRAEVLVSVAERHCDCCHLGKYAKVQKRI